MAFDKAEHQAMVRAKFEELDAKIKAIFATSEPMRAARDEVVRGHHAAEAALNAEIAKVEDGLHSMMNECAMWARQLSGNRSLPAETGGVISADATAAPAA